ncbi:hypothetical protein LUZ60_007379 [Juncus effusus]|nr:hypothetical protein LUZ60_007379 [Juncus effusus]
MGESSRSGDPAAIAGEMARRAIDMVTENAIAVKAAVDSAVDAAFVAAGAAADFSSDRLRDAEENLEMLKSQYALHEEMSIGKIKEGVIIAASNPGLSFGIATGTGLVLLKGPRGFLIQSLRRIFVSNEVLLSSAKTEVNGLRQSVNLVTNENRKLMERSLIAEKQYEKGLSTLEQEGRNIQKQLNYIRGIENQARDLKEVLDQLPRAQASSFRSEASSGVSQVKKEKKALSSTLSKILNYGISV